MKSEHFYKKLKAGDCKAYNIPSDCRKIWANQYAIGYKFDDGSIFVHYHRGIGVHKNVVVNKDFNHWATVSYGDPKVFWAIGTLKYEV